MGGGRPPCRPHGWRGTGTESRPHQRNFPSFAEVSFRIQFEVTDHGATPHTGFRAKREAMGVLPMASSCYRVRPAGTLLGRGDEHAVPFGGGRGGQEALAGPAASAGGRGVRG